MERVERARAAGAVEEQLAELRGLLEGPCVCSRARSARPRDALRMVGLTRAHRDFVPERDQFRGDGFADHAGAEEPDLHRAPPSCAAESSAATVSAPRA